MRLQFVIIRVQVDHLLEAPISARWRSLWHCRTIMNLNASSSRATSAAPQNAADDPTQSIAATIAGCRCRVERRHAADFGIAEHRRDACADIRARRAHLYIGDHHRLLRGLVTRRQRFEHLAFDPRRSSTTMMRIGRPEKSEINL